MAEYFVDIDLTICDTPYSPEGEPDYANSKPHTGNIQIINEFFDQGYTIIYWTSRGAKTGIDWRELTEQQLKEWGCKHHQLRLDKPYYDKLFDDKAWRLPKI